MALAQQGAYRNLLDHSWLANPQGYLPDDDTQLAGMSGAKETWPEMRETVMAMFKKSAKGWSNSRLLIELKKQKKRKADAQSAAKSRWGKYKQGMRSHSEGNADASDPQSIAIASALTTAIAIPTADKEEEKTPQPPKGGAHPDFETWWSHYPKKVDKKNAQAKFKKAMANGAALQTLIDGAGRYAKAQDAKYYMGPAKWLHGERWEDEQTKGTGKDQRDYGRGFAAADSPDE